MKLVTSAPPGGLPRDRSRPARTSRRRVRRTVAGSLLGVAVLAAAACSSSSGSGSASSGGSGSGALESLNLGIAVATPTSATQYVAQDEGFFAKHGLDVHFVTFSGGSASLSALAAGNIAHRAAAIFGETADRHAEGMALSNLAMALAGLQRFEEATSASREEAAIFQQIADRLSFPPSSGLSGERGEDQAQ
jgi:ABC-type nitrate/sulfonate/bicarbonate transport system substrate-binding protein